MLTFINIVGGLILLFVGGEVLIRGAVSVAKFAKVPKLIIGLTVVAYGTSSPELVVSIKAALDNYSNLALGNVIGSNISNMLLVVGISALIYPIAVDKKLARFDGLAMLLVTLALVLSAFWMNLTYIHGFILLFILVVYTYYTLYEARKNDGQLPQSQTDEIEEQLNVKLGKFTSALACIGGTLILTYGADRLIAGSIDLAVMLNVSETVIGLTIIAFGSSVPELATSVIAAFRKHSDIAIGNIIGSNLFNILGVLGSTLLVSTISIEEKVIKFDLPILLAVTLITYLIMRYKSNFSRPIGGLFFIAYIGYILSQKYLVF